jgi:NADPH:quinone reductase-like Zn-dependent oxidoreductase
MSSPPRADGVIRRGLGRSRSHAAAPAGRARLDLLTHPSVSNYTATRAELLAAAHDLFAVVDSGKIKIEISRTYRLQDAARAHADIESRQTTGSIVLVV